MDARQMSDRELLLSIHQTVTGMAHDLYGNGQPGLLKEVEVLRTRVDERTSPSKAQMFSVNAVFTAVLIAIGEYAKTHLGAK